MLREVAHNVRSRAQVRIKPREDVQKDTAEGFRELSRRPLERSGRVLKAFVSAIEHWSATRDDFFVIFSRTFQDFGEILAISEGKVGPFWRSKWRGRRQKSIWEPQYVIFRAVTAKITCWVQFGRFWFTF